MNAVLKWRNKYSGEEGYVKGLVKCEGHFVNTFDINKAKRYRNEKCITNDLRTLNGIGETINNDFTAVIID